ncbi:MAG: hypothetical protein EA339_11675 [Rhodobacteraceae bacterium]|nr:MAG: hypothetical protein EA339_11675 [Paracoccaceae bacterium]
MVSENLPDSTEDKPLSLDQLLQLRSGRAHELCGPARRLLALWALAPMSGAILWIRPQWAPEQLAPAGVCPWLDPARLIVLGVTRDTEALACAEEALRAGAVAGVVAELSSPPPLTPLRRLHLAAEAGLARRGAQGILALLLTPELGGAPGVESRWHLSPCPSLHEMPCATPIAPGWLLRRLRARMTPPAAWQIRGAEALEVQAHLEDLAQLPQLQPE